VRKLVASLIVVSAPAALAQETAPPEDLNQRILEEIRLLRAEVAELARKIDALDERSKRFERPRGRSFVSEPPRELADIKLPAEPTREQVLEYVRAIARASRGQNRFSSQDPQIEMLVRIGRRNVDALIEAFDEPVQETLDFYARWALRRLAGEEHKDVLIASLARHPELAEVILEKKWTIDAGQVLKDGLKGRPHYLPTEWIQAVASLRDPETYEDLIAYFIEGTNKPQTYEAIRSLPGIDLESAVAETWERPRGNFPFIDERKGLAPIAIGHGIGDALETAFGLIGGEEQWLADRAREAILRHTEASGSDDEIKAFHEKNKGRFRWNAELRKFFVDP
jgi:hypothetical protein